MPDFGFERSLLFCLLLNAAVFGSAWFFAARRLTTSRSQALLDAALLGYAVQYVSVGLAGLLGCLDFRYVSGFAMCLVVGMFAAGWKIKPVALPKVPLRDRLIVGGAGLFVAGFVLAFAHSQADLPVISNDALTYHFPAAVQWIQQGRISVFQTWFFNPANAYSPLAGSTFIAWLLLPFGNDIAARFVEVPALLCVGLAMHRLCRELSVRSSVAAVIAGAAVLSRPLFMPCMMGKDDLFVAFFFIATLVALSRGRRLERFGAVRLGIGLGLLLATKYTALLSVPMLLLGLGWRNSTEPGRVGPEARADRGGTPRLCFGKMFVAMFSTVILAGPWYLRNWITTGNPLFPVAIPHLCRGLFTTTRSNAFGSLNQALAILIDVHYGMPIAMLMITGVAICLCLPFVSLRRQPILRACVIGPVVGLAIFYFSSPFPEVRFLLPVFLLMFACTGYAVERLCPDDIPAMVPSVGVFAASVVTLFKFQSVAGTFAAAGLLLAAIGIAGCLWANGRLLRWAMIGTFAIVALGIFGYVNWAAYCRDYLASSYSEQLEHTTLYAQDRQLWTWVNTHLPADARVAYANLYFVYPLQGSSLRRRLVYIPTRTVVKTIADLPWLGDHLPGEAIVPSVDAATIDGPDRRVWLENLKREGCQYLIIGRDGSIAVPPERAFAEADHLRFEKIYRGEAGDVYLIRWR